MASGGDLKSEVGGGPKIGEMGGGGTLKMGVGGAGGGVVTPKRDLGSDGTQNRGDSPQNLGSDPPYGGATP